MSDEIDIQKELKNAGIKPDKTRSQHFLKNNSYIEALVESTEIEERHTVLEIGPGTGTITSKTLEKNPEKLIAVERDSQLAIYLKNKFNEYIKKQKMEIVTGDILDHTISDQVDRCISNLPFQISSEVLEKLGIRQVQSTLILQKELAERLIADPGENDYSHLTIMARYYFLPVKLQEIPRNAYYPKPDVDTSIVKLYPNKERHKIEDEEKFFHVSKALFTHKRKKTRNAFVDARNMLNITKDKAKQIRDEIPHSEKRVINLDIQDIKEIVESLELKIK